MASYQLFRWESIELFVKIIAKHEDKLEEDIEKILKDKLDEYKSLTNSTKVSDNLFKPIALNNGSANFYPKLVGDLSFEIRNRKPTILTTNQLNYIERSLGDRKLVKSYQAINIADNKESVFESTTWWLYTYESYVDNKSGQTQLIIGRFPVQLRPYGYMIINSCEIRNGTIGKSQLYRGQYYIKDGRYLFLEGRMGTTKEKELRAIVNIGIVGGIDIHEILQGYYLNASNCIYFGPILLERIAPQEDLVPQVFKNHDPQIDNAFWMYFNKMEYIPYEIPTEVIKKEDLKSFLDQQVVKAEHR